MHDGRRRKHRQLRHSSVWSKKEIHRAYRDIKSDRWERARFRNYRKRRKHAKSVSPDNLKRVFQLNCHPLETCIPHSACILEMRCFIWKLYGETSFDYRISPVSVVFFPGETVIVSLITRGTSVSILLAKVSNYICECPENDSNSPSVHCNQGCCANSWQVSRAQVGRNEWDRELDGSFGFREIKIVVNSAEAGVLAHNCYEVVYSPSNKFELEFVILWTHASWFAISSLRTWMFRRMGWFLDLGWLF